MSTVITEEEFNRAAASLIARKEVLKSNIDKLTNGDAWHAHTQTTRAEGSEFEVINTYLKQRAQIATTMGDHKIYNACNQLIAEVSKVSNDVSSCENWHQVMHEMNMLELDLRYFCAVTNEGRTKMW